MQKLWEFLLDPANRSTIAWLGGGLVVAAGIALKFYKASKAATPQLRNVTANNGGVAAGGDMTSNTINTSSNGAPAKKK